MRNSIYEAIHTYAEQHDLLIRDVVHQAFEEFFARHQAEV
jgi:hypothetical protein